MKSNKTTQWITMALMLLVTAGCQDSEDTSTTQVGGGSESGRSGNYSGGNPEHAIRDYTYTVVVQNTRGHPVPGAVVTLTLEGYGGLSPVYTSTAGTAAFDFRVPPNTSFGIGVQSTAYLPAAVYDRTGANHSRTFHIVVADF